ncbi:MAG TPA: hypothetical protein DDZ51_20345 [Planctomycetaceae bacterium]|nr:hypothetical protein [Planctomycetaceae bacterium]
MHNNRSFVRAFAITLTLLICKWLPAADDFTHWQRLPLNWKPVAASPEATTLHHSTWAYLIAPDASSHVDISATVTIDSEATEFGFFGSSWSAWPDPTFGDRGFEAGLLLRSNEDGSHGYRVQISHKYQQVALVRFPDGGYLRSVPCDVGIHKPIKLRAKIAGGILRVSIDDKEIIHYVDRLEPTISSGRMGLGVSSGAKVTFTDTKIVSIPEELIPPPNPHKIQLSARPWLGGRTWVFDGDEPILELHSLDDPSCFAKLKPGYKPQLTFDSHWGLENQGAFPEAASRWTAPVVTGGGDSLQVNWSARNVKDRFTTNSMMTIGFDPQRGTYIYGIESELEVLPGEPFHFRYGFDFEHHTPLDPFNWQYLIARKRGGELYHRPVTPTDPGPQYDLEMYFGQRVWYGRHNGDFQVAPAVEYEVDPTWNQVTLDDGTSISRQCNTAVCAAFYDTGVAFATETAKPGTKVRVKYRYTGYPANEAESLFQLSKTYASATLDPKHHYIFADQWPRLTFDQFVPLSQTWQYGRSPFMTGHNQRPTYELEKNCGVGSGYAMKLGPASFGKATLSKAGTLASGRYVVSAWVKSINTFGPGGRIELEATQATTNKVVATAKHFVGNGSFEWQKQGFVFELPENAEALSIAFGNSGTGEMLITDVEFRLLGADEASPPGIAAKPHDSAPILSDSPAGAIADFRMLEGRGHHVLNHAGGEHLNLANLDWVVDEGHTALRFADNQSGRADYHPSSYVGMHIFGHAQDFNYLNSYRAYEGRQSVPFAMAGGGNIILGCERYYLHGAYYRGLIGRTLIFQRTLSAEEIALLARDQPLPAINLSADPKGMSFAVWIKPSVAFGSNNMHPGGGDIIGYGNRRYILKLLGTGQRGENAPYRLAARLNVNDELATEPIVQADQWHHVVLTTSPEDNQRRMRLFINGQQVAEDITRKWSE